MTIKCDGRECFCEPSEIGGQFPRAGDCAAGQDLRQVEKELDEELARFLKTDRSDFLRIRQSLDSADEVRLNWLPRQLSSVGPSFKNRASSSSSSFSTCLKSWPGRAVACTRKLSANFRGLTKAFASRRNLIVHNSRL